MPALADAGIPTAPWTRLLHQRIELCNSLEWTVWRNNPVQVQLCDACGTTGCGSGGYIHLSKVADLVIWTNPQLDPATEQYPATALKRMGAIGFPTDAWNLIMEASSNVPGLSMMETANGRALADAWSGMMLRAKAEETLVGTLRRSLLAADTLETDAAIEKIQHWSALFAERDQVAVNGRLLRVAEFNARVETLYFDGPASDDWPALAEWNRSYYPLLDSSQFFVPDVV